MSASVTGEHAKKIIKKLKASKSATQSTHHKHYDVVEKDKVLRVFAISHTGHKGKPQSHLPDQLALNAYQTKELADCNLSRKDYIKRLNEIDNGDE